jgi:NitT/TauT family transport system ATP-binding protein
MLPHARPGGVAGLLEMLDDRGGRSDIAVLADDLGFELDELLPIVDASALLGFATITEGDAEMTPAGHEFAAADILTRKELFRRASFHNVTLLRQITRALASKRDHSLPDDFFHDILDEHFSEEETVRQLETAVTWGRYAELFDHDAKERRFYLPEETPEAERA